MRSPLAAWTWGRATPARAEAAAMRLVVLINSRRVVRGFDDSFISASSRQSRNVVNSRNADLAVTDSRPFLYFSRHSRYPIAQCTVRTLMRLERRATSILPPMWLTGGRRNAPTLLPFGASTPPPADR